MDPGESDEALGDASLGCFHLGLVGRHAYGVGGWCPFPKRPGQSWGLASEAQGPLSNSPRGRGVLTPDPVPWEDRGSLISSLFPGLFPGKLGSRPAHLSLPASSPLMGGQNSGLPSHLPTSSLPSPGQAPCCSQSKTCEAYIQPALSQITTHLSG